MQELPTEVPDHPLREVAITFLRLGCVSFGGPVAHLGYMRAECVERRRWLDDAHYAELVALCQFLPGPASSQLVFALGMLRAGVVGAVVASVCFLLPSALIMIAAAIGLQHLDNVEHAGWLRGLKLVTVAVVAQAVWSMGTTLCPDATRRALCLVVAATTLLLPSTLTQVAVVVLGALVGWWRYGTPATSAATGTATGVLDKRAAMAALLACAALLVGLPFVARLTGSREVEVFDSFYRAGALVFGGGHVVLPMLRTAVDSVVDDTTFLAGYGIAQALPGPLFAFAGFLGAALHPTSPWAGGALCLFAIYLPASLLVLGALPLWQLVRTRASAQAALTGANAAVVGVLLAALYTPVCTESLRGLVDIVVAVLAFASLAHWKRPWLVVLACAVLGELVF
jgi:chromate transporter